MNIYSYLLHYGGTCLDVITKRIVLNKAAKLGESIPPAITAKVSKKLVKTVDIFQKASIILNVTSGGSDQT